MKKFCSGKRRVFGAMLGIGLSACGMTSQGPDPQLLERAELAYLQGEYSQAAYLYSLCAEGLEGGTDRSKMLLQIGKCWLGAGAWDAAIARFGEALSAGPDEKTRVEIHYRRAMARHARWNLAGALEDLDKVAQAPSRVRGAVIPEEEFRYRLGVTQLRLGDWSTGKKELALVDPQGRLAEDAKLRMALGDFWVQVARCDDPKSAQRVIQEAAARGVRAQVLPDFTVVVVGPFERFQDAITEADRLRGSGFDGAFVIP